MFLVEKMRVVLVFVSRLAFVQILVLLLLECARFCVCLGYDLIASPLQEFARFFCVWTGTPPWTSDSLPIKYFNNFI